jgi:hypothetical protein
MFCRLHIVRPKTVLLGLLLVLAVALYVPDAAHAQAVLSASTLPTFTSTDNALIQQQQLTAYVTANKLSSRIVQVKLSELAKISQYTDINSSDQGFGPDACGLVAAAAALGGADWVPLVGVIAKAAGNNYGQHTGIQPSKYVAALQEVLGTENVRATNATSLGELYQELQGGKIVIVDIKVNKTRVFPSADRPDYAHFARVLGMDVGKQEIYIENTLQGGSYWTVSLQDFVKAWEQPETSASIVPDPQHAEAVTRWAVILNVNSLPGG